MTQPGYYQKKIMIVDDDPDIVFSLNTLFTKEGFDVCAVDNGRKCLLELEKGFEGIIILDLMMPVMDGVETIRKMSTDGFMDHNIVIVLTAKRVQGDEFNEIYPYVTDFITKPFDINALVQTVKKIALRPPPKKRN
jgi:DNA-binding response OmpR family regulator